MLNTYAWILMKNLYPAILYVLALCMAIPRAQGQAPNSGFADHSITQKISNADDHASESVSANNYFFASSILGEATQIEEFNAGSNAGNTNEVEKATDFLRVNLSAPVNDNFAGAPDISGLINTSCTSGGLYTTLGATPDQSKGTCWSNGPNNNVWFKFVATATGFINVQVKVSGAGETLRNPFVAIFDASLTQIACENYQGSAVDLSLSNLGLIPGNTYYIAVDNYAGYAGSFDLCLSDVPDYDYPIGAKNVNSLIDASCTSGGIYTTQFATPDDAKGTCWSNGPNNNRWFKFTATATGFINVQVKVSGAGETLRNPFVAIFDASLTQVACQNFQGSAVDLSLSSLGLIPGNTYYISVDNYAGYAGSFDLCLSDVPDYDYPIGAKNVNSLIDASCTSGGIYTTQFATPDDAAGTCWSNGPNNNRWFKFTATATGFINVQVKVSGAGETLRNPFVAIFDAGFTQVACQNFQGSAVDLSLSSLGLIPGNTYYISVDNYAGYAGSFDLCLTDVPDYDYPIGARDVNSLINSSCTSGGVYTTQFATPDDAKGTCWSNGPNNNRWFKFTATATGFINVQVKVSGAGETLRNPFVAIFDASLTQVACQNFQGSAVDLSLSSLGLVPGNTYYISVDNFAGYAGSFDLCLTDVPDYDYPIGAKNVNSLIDASCTSGGIYTTQFATPDDSKGTCWSNGPNNNRWFKFTATATGFMNVQVKVSGAGETLRNPFVAIFDASLSQVACQNFQGASIDQCLGVPNLIPGNIYYIAVDNFAGYAGSFDLCLNDVVPATISYPGSPFCATGTVNPTQTGQAGGTYSSQAGLSINAATGTINLLASTAGTYKVTYTLATANCVNTVTTMVTINALPVATISYPGSPYCATGTATVTQTGQGGGTYSSTAGLSLNASTGAVNLATSTAGTYTVTYTFTNGTCSNSTTKNITITALPTATISYAGNPYCATGNATVTRAGQAGGTYSSTAGLSLNAATGAINLATSTAGTYTVTYSFTSGACSNTTTSSVTINALPVATISYAGSPYCATGTATVTQTGQAGGTYTAPAGLSINAATGAINLSASTAGAHTVTYTFSNGTCINTTTFSITINALPVATISYAASPYCATGNAVVTRVGQAGGTYSSTAGLSITAATGAINLGTSTPGTYTVTYSFTNGTCSNTATTSVIINALPAATISYAGSPYCATGTATVTQTGQGGGTYSSTAGLILTAATGAINLSTSTAGTYTVKYTFTNGTCSNTTTASITINALPAATISYSGSPYCATGTATVTQTGQGGGTYSSTAGLNITAATGAINLASSTPGTYLVTYSFTNGTCGNTATTSVTIKALPIATISYAGSPYCATGTATATQTGQAGGTYSSTVGLSLTAATGAINLATSTPGTYTVTYSFTNGTCSNTTTTSVTINALPIASISYAASPYCATGTATVTQAGQAGGTYSSTAGLNITAATGDINLSTSTPGVYTITYTFSSGACSNTATTSVTINALPAATISYPGSPFCATATGTVTQTGQGGGTYTAAAGVVINAATGDIDLAASTPGIYTITYSFSNGTCSNTATTSITITLSPIVLITNPPAVCSPATVDITANSVTAGSTAGLVYSYYQDAAATIPLANPNAIPLSGTYYIQGATPSGCKNIQPVVVTINPKPAVIITNPAAVCWPGTVNITTPSITAGSTAGLTYSYYEDAAATVVLPNPNAINVGGTYYIEGTTALGCSDIQPVVATINPLPSATVSYNGSPYCTTGTAFVSLTGQGGGTYASSPGLVINSATGDIDLASSAEGTYTIVYTFSNGVCGNSSITSVTIKNPFVQVNNPPGICSPGTVDLTDPAVTAGSESGLSFSFYQDASGLVPVVNPAAMGTSGVYFVKGVNSSTGCASDLSSVVVTIFPKPAITASSSDSDICKGSAVTLTASSPGNTIDWIGIGSGNSVSVTPMDSTSYLAVATSPDGCNDTAEVNISVRPFKINLSATPDPVLAGTSTTLTTTGNFTYNILSWSPDIFFADQTALTQTIVVKDTSKSFTVIGQSADGCLDTAILYVVVDPNLKDFFIPNSFSPNNDGNNDIFRVYGSSVKEVILRIYNQWGELISETYNSQGWDGTWKGRPQQVGVYIYEAKVTFYNNVTIKRKGTVNLIR